MCAFARNAENTPLKLGTSGSAQSAKKTSKKNFSSWVFLNITIKVFVIKLYRAPNLKHSFL